MTLSPRLPSGLACDTAESGPADAELSRMTELALRRGARSVAIGRGRSAAAAAAATAFASRWEASGGTVLTVVTWPEEAASWLRQANRFAAADPDLWIMTGPPCGWAQMTRLLAVVDSPGSLTVLSLSPCSARRARSGSLAPTTCTAFAGATADGGTWTICDGSIHALPGDTVTRCTAGWGGPSRPL